MMKTLLLFPMLAATTVSNAEAIQLKAPNPDLSAAEKSGSLVITVKPPAQHHINDKAPASLQMGSAQKSPRSVTRENLEFEVPLDSQLSHPGSLTLSLYLCDDKNTFCERHVLDAQWD